MSAKNSGLYSKDTKQVSDALLRLEEAPPKLMVLQPNIVSRNRFRIFCFKQKKILILSPVRYLVTDIMLGFLLIMPIMVSLIIFYEKLDANFYSFADGVVPLILLAAFLLLSALTSIVVMMKDVFLNGCMVWDRDALGLHF